MPAGLCIRTSAGKLPFKHIVHTVTQVDEGQSGFGIDELRQCITNSIDLAAVHRAKSIAIPAICSDVSMDICAQAFFRQIILYAKRKQMQ